jgi:hypothetical protein
MVSSPLGEREVAEESREGGYYRYGYRRGRFSPFWLVFPLMFLVFRGPMVWGWGYGPGGAYVPGVFLVIPLVVLGIIVLRIVLSMLPALGDGVRPRMRHAGAAVEREPARLQQVELDLIDAHRQIKELEEKVAWQSRLLEIQTAAGERGENDRAGH